MDNLKKLKEDSDVVFSADKGNTPVIMYRPDYKPKYRIHFKMVTTENYSLRTLPKK